MAEENKLRVHVYKRYVDDVEGALSQIPKGSKFNPQTKRVEMSNEQYKDDMEDDNTDEQRTFQIFKEMADSVTRMLTWEYDIPEFHPDRMLPMLDLKMYVNKDTRGPTLMHSFYKKDMSSR